MRLKYHLAKPCISGEGSIIPIPESNTIHIIYWLSGVCGHSNKHTPWHIQEVQYAFKDLMIHEVCNSHYVSHFAAFFIVVGTKTSVAESRMAFASYARGMFQTQASKHPHPLLFRFMLLFVFGIVFNLVYMTCTISQSLILEI